MQDNSWENSKALLCESPQIDASSVAQNGMFVMNPVYPGGVTMLDTGEKSLDHRPSEMPKKCTLQDLLLCLRESFSEYPRDSNTNFSISLFNSTENFMIELY